MLNTIKTNNRIDTAKGETSGFLSISEMDQRWVLEEIEKGRADVKEGKTSMLPKTFEGFLEEMGVENLLRRAYR